MSEEPEYDLVMPFVLVESRGGPYADVPYVAGYSMGLLDAELRVAQLLNMTPAPRPLSPDDKPQVDLLAMRYGFTVIGKPYDDHYTIYEFQPVTP